MSLTFQKLFSPIFIITAIVLFIVGVVIMQMLDKIFLGSPNINAIRMFFLAIIINIIIFVFLVMSFSKVKFAVGPVGPQGNKGYRGREGDSGGLEVCGIKYQTAEEKKQWKRSIEYLDMKPPVIIE